MKAMNWEKVALTLRDLAQTSQDSQLDPGQKDAVLVLAKRIEAGQRGQLLADEVGMGKTRIAAALIEAVRRCNGRSAIILPPGLGPQWQKELRVFNPKDQSLLPLRSYESFISGFMSEEDLKGSKQRQSGQSRALNNRRLQRELPEKTWRKEDIVMISHTFANMQFNSKSDSSTADWRSELFEHVVRFKKDRGRRVDWSKIPLKHHAKVRATRRAAITITASMKAYRKTVDLAGKISKLDGDEYHKRLLPLIGLGLGRFDLVIIDEAHKARGLDSSLSQILKQMLVLRKTAFTLGMTATPVELDSKQWIDTLSRILSPDALDNLNALSSLIEAYVKVTERLKTEVLTESLTAEFESTAQAFEAALAPLVIRRDKRNDPDYVDFIRDHGDYRKIIGHEVGPGSPGFNRDWLRKLCAYEALSLLPQTDHALKSARLSMAQGFGFAYRDTDTKLLPQKKLNPATQEKQEEIRDNKEIDRKTLCLKQNDIWLDAYGRKAENLYRQPALLKAVEVIEQQIKDDDGQGGKVLVFGKYIKPMTALTQMLDMREMLRRIHAGQPWPASVLPDYAAKVLDALRGNCDLHVPPLAEIANTLALRHKEQAAKRARDLQALNRDLKLAASDDETAAFLMAYFHEHDPDAIGHGHIGTLLEALNEMRSDTSAPWGAAELLSLFKQLREDLIADLEGADTEQDEQKKASLQARLTAHLQDFSGREGNFARMMWSQTSAQTRRILQASFNRRASWPKVLLAQSRVGREGLNLHRACQNVVLLHAEWNPGVVEQQIGRVDRKNSLWLQKMGDWRVSGGEPPRIKIHYITVRGSYDSHNWHVLNERWRNLRAQLHGTLELLERGKHPLLEERLSKATPDFTPNPEGPS